MNDLRLCAVRALLLASPLSLFALQAAAQEPPPPPAVTPPAAPPPAAPLPAAAPPPADPPPPAAAASVEVAVATPAPPAPPRPPPPPAEREPEPAVASPLRLSLFADAYWNIQTSESGTPATLSGHRAFAGQGSAFNGPGGTTRLAENGFSLAWLGFDASYDAGAFAVTGSLRFGQGAAIFHNSSDAAFGIDNITQGYVTWRPVQGLDLDLGMFGTPFGAEVAESWKNLNYTRGALYYYAQPFWHTGLRAKYAVSDQVSLTGLLVNGTNNISETQQGTPPGIDQAPTIGAQVGFAPTKTLSLALGGLVATDGEENDDLGFDTFLDLVAVLNLGALSAVFNADYILTQNPVGGADDRGFFGVSGGIGYALSDMFGIAGRVEFLRDGFAGGYLTDTAYDGSDAESWNLLTLTATLTFKPLPETPNIIIRWDNRFEKSNQDVFGDAFDAIDPDDSTFKDNWFQSVIGVVVTTSP